MSIDIIKYNGKTSAAYSHDSEQTIAGFLWQFLLNSEQVLVVLPYETKHNPAVNVHRIPISIEPILAGWQGMGELGFIAMCIQTLKRQDFAASCTLSGADKQEFNRWKKKHDFKALDKWEKDVARMYSKFDAEWEKNASQHEPTPELIDEWRKGKKDIEEKRLKYVDDAYSKLLKKARAKLESDTIRLKVIQQQQQKIRKKEKQLIDKKNNDQRNQYQEEILLRINGFIEKHTGSYPVRLPPLSKGKACYSVEQYKKFAKALKNNRTKGGRLLDDIYQRIETVYSKVETSADYNQLLEFIADAINTDINALRQYLFKAYSPEMPGHINQLVEETVQAEGMSEEEARQHLFDNVNYVADFGDGIKYLVKDIFLKGHNYRDSLCWERINPTPEKSKQIEKQIVTANQTRQSLPISSILSDLPTYNYPPAAPWKIKMLFGISDYVWQELSRAHPEWKFEDGSWDTNKFGMKTNKDGKEVAIKLKIPNPDINVHIILGADSAIQLEKDYPKLAPYIKRRK